MREYLLDQVLWIRTKTTPGAAGPIILSVIGVALLGVSGWLGGELVFVHRVGVSSDIDQMRVSDQEMRVRQRRKAV